MSLPGNCWITWVTDMKTVYVPHPNQMFLTGIGRKLPHSPFASSKHGSSSDVELGRESPVLKQLCWPEITEWEEPEKLLRHILEPPVLQMLSVFPSEVGKTTHSLLPSLCSPKFCASPSKPRLFSCSSVTSTPQWDLGFKWLASSPWKREWILKLCLFRCMSWLWRQSLMCEMRERLHHAHPRLLEALAKEFAVLAAGTLNYRRRFSATTTENPEPEFKILVRRQDSGSDKSAPLTSALPKL